MAELRTREALQGPPPRLTAERGDQSPWRPLRLWEPATLSPNNRALCPPPRDPAAEPVAGPVGLMITAAVTLPPRPQCAAWEFMHHLRAARSAQSLTAYRWPRCNKHAGHNPHRRCPHVVRTNKQKGSCRHAHHQAHTPTRPPKKRKAPKEQDTITVSRPSRSSHQKEFGSVLLSHEVPLAVPSALSALASGFGM